MVDSRHQRAEGGVGAEGHLTGHGFDEHECERVEIGLAGERFALRLFG